MYCSINLGPRDINVPMFRTTRTYAWRIATLNIGVLSLVLPARVVVRV